MFRESKTSFLTPPQNPKPESAVLNWALFKESQTLQRFIDLIHNRFLDIVFKIFFKKSSIPVITLSSSQHLWNQNTLVIISTEHQNWRHFSAVLQLYALCSSHTLTAGCTSSCYKVPYVEQVSFSVSLWKKIILKTAYFQALNLLLKILMLRRGEELVCCLAHIWNKLNSCATVRELC